MRCDACGTMNRDTARFCLYCGASLTTPAPEATTSPPPAPEPATPAERPIPKRTATFVRARSSDFVGLFGVAFFFLIVGVVFYLNSNLLTELRHWWDNIVGGRAAFRPPEGVITSAAWFWALLGVANFGIAYLRWEFTRSRIGTLAALLGGIGMIAFGYLLYRYSVRAMSGSVIVAAEAAVIATLLFIFIGTGLYWTTARRRPVVGGTYRSPRP